MFAAGTARGRGIQTEIAKEKKKRTHRDSERRGEVNREIMPTCHTFQYGSQKKVLGWFPGSANFGEVKGHCIWTMTPAQRLLTGRGQGHCGKGTEWLLLPVRAV